MSVSLHDNSELYTNTFPDVLFTYMNQAYWLLIKPIAKWTEFCLFVIISIFIGTRKRTTSIRKVVIYKRPYLQIEQWCNYYPTPPICVQAVTLFCWFFSIVRLVLLASLVFGDMTIRIYFSQKRKIFFEIRVFLKK